MVKLNKRQRVAIMDSTFNPVFAAKIIIEARKREGVRAEDILTELEKRFDTVHSPHQILMDLEKKSGLKISMCPGRPGHADPCGCSKCRRLNRGNKNP
jgi:hypothetical protein